MLRQALTEVRLHPGRFVSTLVAIAISVAFMAGSATLVATESQAQGRALSLPVTMADLVVEGAWGDRVGAAILDTPGVGVAHPVAQLTEAVSEGDTSLLLSLYLVPPEELQWSRLVAGRWPRAATEIALSRGAADALGVGAGGTVQGAAADEVLTVTGVTDEPSTFLLRTGYAAPARFTAAGLAPGTGDHWAVRAAPGTDPAALAELLRERVVKASEEGSEVTVRPADVVRAEALQNVTNDFAAFTYLLWSFAAIALVVGMITIANTFSITLAQRRRQIGLLRAVGASGAQVRWRFFAEALLLGAAGSVAGLLAGMGLAAAAAAWTGSLYWGLALPWVELGVAAGLGVLATLLAAWLPIVRGTRVHPLEALQPVLTEEQQRRVSLVRAVLCGLVLALGAALAVFALSGHEWGFAGAIGAGALISLAVLFGAPLFVPTLLRVTGVLLHGSGPVPRLAAANAQRNPRRATATATALMLAVGLIVTLQVGSASVRDTILTKIEADNPIDLSVAWSDSTTGAPGRIPARVSDQFGTVPGVATWVELDAAQVEASVVAGGTWGLTLLAYDPAIAAVTGTATTLGDDEVLVQSYTAEELGKRVTLTGGHGKAKLAVRATAALEPGQAMVSRALFARIAGTAPATVAWLSVPDRSHAVEAIVALERITGSDGPVGGSIAQAAVVEQVLNLLLGITTALLGVAVLIALIGVSNTLGLSVLERSRESALLRALGLQARSLRVMLTLEAMQVTLIGVGVGIAAGAFFGWLAVSSLGRTLDLDAIRFAIDVPQTAAMVGVAVVAAALASLLPGRRAARAVPTEALADI
jgi:putative ABC transport system permease protein